GLAVFGRYVVTAPVLDALARMQARRGDELQLTSGLAAGLSCPPGVFAVRFDGEFFDGGTPEDYARSTARYATGGIGRSGGIGRRSTNSTH
ncbi:MAG TPA: hypothetical protein VLW53_18735, partial [Candidatus Eisenbacteria bacterium]|nr:hypothetical protein [Candidatus Eisenbacteria bacterium]